MGSGRVLSGARPSLARLSGRDRTAPHATQEESDGWRSNAVAGAAPFSDRVRAGGSTNTRKFFADAGIRDEELRKLEDAWSKAVQLYITFWSRPYVKDGLW